MSSKSIQVCVSNIENHGLPIEEWKQLGIQIDVKDCLSYCSECPFGPFFISEGEPVFEDELEQLQKILLKEK